MSELSPTAKAIFNYKDPRQRPGKLCGNDVMIVAPPLGAIAPILKFINPSATAEEINKSLTAGDIIGCAPEILINCVREIANPKIHMFPDTSEVRAELKDLPYDETLVVVRTAIELMGLGAGVAGEVKNS